MKWERKIFKDFIKLQRGFDLPKSQFVEGEYPVIGSTSILGYHNQYKVNGPGVITGRSGTLGQVQYVSTDYYPHNTSLWVKDFKGNTPRFVYYLLKTINLAKYNGGGAVPTLNRNVLDNIELSIPNIDTQEKIASLLSAYDDLIENNLKRIKLLEESAQLLYRQWFVDFKFPSYENTKFIKGIPEGWEKKSLCDIAEINARNIKDKKAYSTINYIDISSVTTGIIHNKTVYDILEAPGRAKRIVKDGDIIWSNVRPNRKSYSLILDPLENDIASTGFSVLSATEVPFTFLYQAVTTDEFVGYLVNNATGSAYPAVKASDFEKAELLTPSKDILEEFHIITESVHRNIHSLLKLNQKLKEARDILLPRLMDGSIEV